MVWLSSRLTSTARAPWNKRQTSNLMTTLVYVFATVWLPGKEITKLIIKKKTSGYIFTNLSYSIQAFISTKNLARKKSNNWKQVVKKLQKGPFSLDTVSSKVNLVPRVWWIEGLNDRWSMLWCGHLVFTVSYFLLDKNSSQSLLYVRAPVDGHDQITRVPPCMNALTVTDSFLLLKTSHQDVFCQCLS